MSPGSTKHINKMLLQNGYQCLSWRNLYLTKDGQVTLAVVDALIWFKNQVNNNKPWDIKRQIQWQKELQGVPYLGLKGKFVWNGEVIDAESAGNITYGFWGRFMGFWGRFMGFGAKLIYWGGGYAHQKARNPKTDFYTLILKDESQFYGDAKEDHYNIKKGIDMVSQNNKPLIDFNGTEVLYNIGLDKPILKSIVNDIMNRMAGENS